jgi:hypothetical protein
MRSISARRVLRRRLIADKPLPERSKLGITGFARKEPGALSRGRDPAKHRSRPSRSGGSMFHVKHHQFRQQAVGPGTPGWPLVEPYPCRAWPNRSCRLRPAARACCVLAARVSWLMAYGAAGTDRCRRGETASQKKPQVEQVPVRPRSAVTLGASVDWPTRRAGRGSWRSGHSNSPCCGARRIAEKKE